MKGYIKLGRDIRQCPIWYTNPIVLKIHIHLLMRAAHAEHTIFFNGKQYDVKVGEVVFSLRKELEKINEGVLKTKDKATIGQLRQYIKLFKMLQLGTHVSSKEQHTLCYAQIVENELIRLAAKKATTHLQHGEQHSNNTATTHNIRIEKNSKEEEEEDSPSLALIDLPEVPLELWYKQPLRDVKLDDTKLTGFNLSCLKFVKSYQKAFLKINETDYRIIDVTAYDWFSLFRDWRNASPAISDKEISAVAKFAISDEFWMEAAAPLKTFIKKYDTIKNQAKNKANAIRQNS